MEIISKSQLKREIIQGKYSECELASTLFEQFKLISSLKQDLNVAEKALEKMSEYALNDNSLYDLVDDFNIENERYDEDHFGIDACDVVDYFKEQAENKLKRE